MSDSKKPRILYCTSHCPGGPAYGAQLRATNIARYLQQHAGDVSIALFAFAEPDAIALQATRQEFDLRAVFRLIPDPKKSIFDHLRHELDPYYTNTHGSRISDEDKALFEKIRVHYDLIWFHGVRIPNSLGQVAWPDSVLDIDDIPSQFHASSAKRTDTFTGRLREYRKVLQWRRREQVLLKRFNLICVCSEADRLYLGSDNRICLIPNGFEYCTPPENTAKSAPPSLGFIGTLEYKPNRDGVTWFIDEVWGKVRAQFPDARLRLVGKGTEVLSSELNGIDGLGWVQDASSEIASWSLMIVPILTGGGTRIKIVEAFSRCCPVVSTRLGSFGYQLDHGEELLLADSPDEFAQACTTLLRTPEYGEQMTKKAWDRFDREWSWPAIAPRVKSVVDLWQVSS